MIASGVEPGHERATRSDEPVSDHVAPGELQPDPVDPPGREPCQRQLHPGLVFGDDGSADPARCIGGGRRATGIASRSHELDRQRAARPVAECAHDPPHAAIADVRDQDRPLPAPVEPADPGDVRRDHGVLVGEHVGVVPLDRDQTADRGPIRVEVAGVFIGLDDEVPAAAHAGDRRRRRREVGRQRCADEPGRVPAALGEEMQQPSRGGRLAVRAGDADQAAASRRCCVGDDLLDLLRLDAGAGRREHLRMVRMHGGDRLGDRQPVDDGCAGLVDDVPGVVRRGDPHPGRGDRRRQMPHARGVACGHARPHGGGVDRRAGRSRAAHPEDMDPLACADGSRGARGREAARDLGGGAGHEDAGEGVEIDGFAAGAGVASTRRSSSSNAARALSTLLPFRSRSQRWRIDLDAVAHRRPRGT